MTREELLNELQEQARLVGMGAERELALKAQVDRLERMNAELLEALLMAVSALERSDYIQMDGDSFDVIEVSRAAMAKARGEK
jgi:hypothetical protein